MNHPEGCREAVRPLYVLVCMLGVLLLSLQRILEVVPAKSHLGMAAVKRGICARVCQCQCAHPQMCAN